LVLTDLNSLFNWNTKQVFLYLKAVYPSSDPDQPASEAIIWDAILASDSAPWHVNHYVHPVPKGSKKPKKNNKDKRTKQEKAIEERPYPIGEIHLVNQRPKYQITDITGKLQNRTDVVLEVGWNVQPWVGALVWTNKKTYGAWEGLKGGVTEKFDFPEVGKKMKDLETAKGKEGYRLEVGGEHPVRKGGKA
jgi:signal peptidase complex subunit 3